MIQQYRDFIHLRRDLQRELGDNIAAAKESNWNPGHVERIQVDVRRMLLLATRFSMYLLIAVFVLAVVVITFLLGHKVGEPYGNWYRTAWIITWIVASAALWLYWPLVGLMRTLRLLPEPVYRELIQPIRISLDLLNIAINIVILLYVLVPLHIGRAFPLVIICGAVWLFAPIVLFLGRQDSLFLAVRVGQLVVIFVGALFSAVSPVPLSQYQWWAQREMADGLRIVHQQDVTDRWAELQWFTPEGVPMVWYSFRKDSGYHLYSAPGHDPVTNAELREVTDEDTRRKILDDLRERESAQERSMKDSREREVRLAALKQEEDAKKTQLANEMAARDEAARLANENVGKARKREEVRQELIRRYVYSPFATGAAKSATVLISLNERGEADRMLGSRLAKAFAAGGRENVEGVFTPSFVGSDAFSSLNSGNGTGLSFPAADFAARLLVVQQQTAVTRQSAAGTENMMAATTTLTVRLIRTDSGRIEYENEVSGRGVGFKEETARADALERAEVALSKLAPQLPSLK